MNSMFGCPWLLTYYHMISLLTIFFFSLDYTMLEVQQLRQVSKKTSTGKLRTFLKICQSRCILSKPVVLVLALNCLVIYSVGAFGWLERSHTDLVSFISDSRIYQAKSEYASLYLVGIVVSWTAAGFTSVWLAGWKYKLTDIVMMGLVIVGVAVLLRTIIFIVAYPAGITVVVRILSYASSVLAAFGIGFVTNNTIQLSIEQIPEASSAQLSSLASWLVFSSALGWWLQLSLNTIWAQCIESLEGNSISALTISCFVALALILYFLFKHQLLDNSLTSNSMHTIYLVLKYAYQHKHPVRRSSMTYWEDAPISRFNFGKRKYGGPFTNEQVEDVKTFLRMSVLFFGILIYLCCLYIHSYSLYYVDHSVDGRNHSLHVISPTNTDSCGETILYFFSRHYSWWMIIFVILYELFIIPLLYHKLPNILHRLTLVGVSSIPLTVVNTVIVTIDSFSLMSYDINIVAFQVIYSVSVGFLKAFFYISCLELICAQAPYCMRNFFISLAWTIGWCCPMITPVVFTLWKQICTKDGCAFSYALIWCIMCVVSLVLVLALLKSYRIRSRGQEDEQNQRRWVEEAYERYVAQNRVHNVN